MANIAARLIVAGTVHRIDVNDMPESADGRFKARRAVKALVLTNGGGFAEISFPEESARFGEYLRLGSSVTWVCDLMEGRNAQGPWHRVSFVSEVAVADAASAVNGQVLADV